MGKVCLKGLLKYFTFILPILNTPIGTT